MSEHTFIATTGHGLARAAPTAAGKWEVDVLLADQDVRCLAADPRSSEVVYAGTQGNGVLRSVDGGKTWLPAGLSGHVVKSIAVSRSEPGAVYAGMRPARVFVSRDGGTQWEELRAFQRIFSRRFWFSPAEKPFAAYVQGIALSPTDPKVIVVGIEAGAVVRSTDAGKTWRDHRKGALRDCHSITYHAASGDWVYEGGGTGGGAAFSRDAGNTWIQAKKGLDRHYGWAAAADPARPDVWYVSVSPSPMKAHSADNAQAYIFRSIGGGTWEKLGGGLPQPLNYMPYALLTEPAASGHLYAGLSNGDVWHTTDYGETWEQLPFNLHSISRSMLIL